MTAVRRRLQALVDSLATRVTTHLILRYRQRLTPETLEMFREWYADVVQTARLIGALHPDEDPERHDLENEDTEPGFRHPPKK